MRKVAISLIFLFVVLPVFAQKSKTLLHINNEKVLVDEFKRVYEKNLDAIQDEDSKDIDKNLDLFINYKLKVKDAYSKKLDTLRSYKREIETYKNQLSAPYLQDKEFTEKLIREAYYRTKNELRASHILIRTPQNGTDTLKAFNKINAIKSRIANGESFEKVAEEASEDPSAKSNKGDLGYFSAFKMVYPFEDNAYKTKVGEVSQPFKTRFGYHIVKPTATRLSKGEIEVAHILVTDTTAVGTKKINEAYQKLKKGEKFETVVNDYTNDIGSKEKGGILPKFGSGRMVLPLEEASFALQNKGDFSKPFRTRFGWHIVKLIKKHPIKSYENMKSEIEDRVRKSGRIRLSDEAVLNKLKNKYNIVINEEARKAFNREDIRGVSRDSLQNTIITINDKKIKQTKFLDYIRNRRHKAVNVLFEMFLDNQVLNYFKENLVNTEPAYANTLKEYQDGLLLFELMQRKVWNKSSKDTLGLQKFFDKNKAKYNGSKLKDVRGDVMNDYQKELEDEWVKALRKKYKVQLQKREVRRLKKYYTKKQI